MTMSQRMKRGAADGNLAYVSSEHMLKQCSRPGLFLSDSSRRLRPNKNQRSMTIVD